MGAMTTAHGMGSSFPVQDITNRNVRSQDEVRKANLAKHGITDTDRPTPVPKSLTPEQLMDFYTECAMKESDRTKIYLHTVKLIKEYDRLLKENKMQKSRIARLEDDILRLQNGGEDDEEPVTTMKEDGDE